MRVRSFFAGAALQNVYVEITGLTPTGREACNSAPAFPGTSSQLGLFAYGAISRAGETGDSAVATWQFRLPSTVRFTFTARVVADYVEPEAQVSGPGSATLEPGGLAFDGAGNGLAAWRAGSDKILYACYDAGAGAWTEARLLDGRIGAGSWRAPRVAASATGFAVAWFGGGNSGVQASVFNGCTPGPFVSLATSLYGYDVAIGSNGVGFLVAWAGTQYGSVAAAYDGSAWTQSYFTSDTFVDGIRVVGEGADYRVLYTKSLYAYSSRLSAGVWSTVQLGNGSTVAAASSGAVTCMAWLYPPLAYARIETGGVVTSSPSYLFTDARAIDVAVDGAGRCLLAVGTSSGASSRLWDGASWQAAVSLGLSGPVTAVDLVRHDASEFAAAALQGSDLWLNRTTGGAWGTATRAETSPEPARAPVLAASAASAEQLVFAQAGAAADEVSSIRWESAAPAAGAPLDRGDRRERKGGPDGRGRQRRCARHLVPAAPRVHVGLLVAAPGRRLSTAQLLAENAVAHAIASNGADFMVAYDVGTPRTLVARRFSSGAFGPPVTVSTYDGSISVGMASDGSGYALVYVVSLPYPESNNPLASIFDGTTWQAAKRLTATGSKSTSASVAGRAGEYLFAWIDQIDHRRLREILEGDRVRGDLDVGGHVEDDRDAGGLPGRPARRRPRRLRRRLVHQRSGRCVGGGDERRHLERPIGPADRRCEHLRRGVERHGLPRRDDAPGIRDAEPRVERWGLATGTEPGVLGLLQPFGRERRERLRRPDRRAPPLPTGLHRDPGAGLQPLRRALQGEHGDARHRDRHRVSSCGDTGRLPRRVGAGTTRPIPPSTASTREAGCRGVCGVRRGGPAGGQPVVSPVELAARGGASHPELEGGRPGRGGCPMQRTQDPIRAPQVEADATPVADERPAYEPPRIVKKRSVSRATLASSISGCGPDGCPGAVGLVAGG